MSATLAPPTRPVATPAPRTLAPATAVAPAAAQVADPEAAELNRWLIGLGTPFVLGAVFFALSIATAPWMIGISLVLGPMLFLLMTIYLCLSSDLNGAAPEPAP